MIIFGSISRIALMVRAKWSAPPSFRSSRATAVMTTCFNFIRRTASATRPGSSSSRANGFAVVTAQNPQARVQRSPAIIIVAVPWLQHSQRFGHCALSQTVCNRKSEISAFVEKKTGFDGSRTLIQGGFLGLGSIGRFFSSEVRRRGVMQRRDPAAVCVVASAKITRFFQWKNIGRLSDHAEQIVRPRIVAANFAKLTRREKAAKSTGMNLGARF